MNIYGRLTYPIKNRPITEVENSPTDEMADWIEQITRVVNQLQPFSGSGSPEGVVTANKYKVYIDDAGGSGSLAYVKMTDGGSTGWVAI